MAHFWKSSLAAEDDQPAGLFAHIALASDDTDADFQRAVEAGAGVQMEPKTVDLPTAIPRPLCGSLLSKGWMANRSNSSNICSFV